MKRFTDLATVTNHIESLLGSEGSPAMAKYLVYALMRDEVIITAPDGYYLRSASDEYWLMLLQEGIENAA